MNRRKFLKLTGISGMAAALPLPALGALWPKTAPLPEVVEVDPSHFPGLKDLIDKLPEGQMLVTPNTEVFWANRPASEGIEDLIPADLVPPEIRAGIERLEGQKYWALSDLTVHGLGGESMLMANNVSLWAMPPVSTWGVQREMWPPQSDLLIPAEARLTWNGPTPKAWCAIVRAPNDEWFVWSDNTHPGYKRLQNPNLQHIGRPR